MGALSDRLKRLHEATRDTYTFSHVKKFEGEEFEITKVSLVELAVKHMPLLQRLTESTEIEKLETMEDIRRVVDKKTFRQLVLGFIDVIDSGCAEFSERIHPDLKSCPKTKDGKKQVGHWVYSELEEDFWGLVYAILATSGFGDNVANLARMFRFQQGTPSSDGPDGEAIRDTPEPAPGDGEG